MSGEKKNIIYSSKDIEAYFTGQLSPSQRHAMEKDALDDAFLAEAMEGYEAMQGKSWTPMLTELHRYFEEERSPARVIPLNRSTSKWWKVAAAILVIGCGATLTYVLTNKKSADSGKSEIAKVETQPATPAVVPTKEETVTRVATTKSPATKDQVAVDKNTPSTNGPVAQNTNPGPNGSTTIAEKKTTEPGNKGDVAVTTPKQVEIDDKVKTKPSVVADEKDRKANVASTARVVVPPSNNGTVAANAVNDGLTARAAEEFAKKKAEPKPAVANNNQSLIHNFTAQVVGPDNTPLPFANITIKNEDFGTYADVKGNFRLVSSDSLVNVEVRSVGYLPRVFTMRSNAPQNRIVLAEDENTAKERAVVINNGMPSNRSARRAVMKDSLYVNVEPADGWDNYNAYVRNNIDIPENALKKKLHGEVELSFKVHPDGTVSDITVNQSDCADCAELAKRLVEQGPQWKIKKGIRKSSARIKVQF